MAVLASDRCVKPCQIVRVEARCRFVQHQLSIDQANHPIEAASKVGAMQAHEAAALDQESVENQLTERWIQG